MLRHKSFDLSVNPKKKKQQKRKELKLENLLKAFHSTGRSERCEAGSRFTGYEEDKNKSYNHVYDFFRTSCRKFLPSFASHPFSCLFLNC